VASNRATRAIDGAADPDHPDIQIPGNHHLSDSHIVFQRDHLVV
jgi:hypothetical protein